MSRVSRQLSALISLLNFFILFLLLQTLTKHIHSGVINPNHSLLLELCRQREYIWSTASHPSILMFLEIGVCGSFVTLSHISPRKPRIMASTPNKILNAFKQTLHWLHVLSLKSIWIPYNLQTPTLTTLTSRSIVVVPVKAQEYTLLQIHQLPLQHIAPSLISTQFIYYVLGLLFSQ